MWSEDDWCQTRRVWLECYEIPLHAWSAKNITKIGEEWDAEHSLDHSTEKGKSYSSARILVDTYVWQNIHEWVFLSINGKGFDVFVKEVGRERFNQISSSRMEDEETKGIDMGASNSQSAYMPNKISLIIVTVQKTQKSHYGRET